MVGWGGLLASRGCSHLCPSVLDLAPHQWWVLLQSSSTRHLPAAFLVCAFSSLQHKATDPARVGAPHLFKCPLFPPQTLFSFLAFSTADTQSTGAFEEQQGLPLGSWCHCSSPCLLSCHVQHSYCLNISLWAASATRAGRVALEFCLMQGRQIRCQCCVQGSVVPVGNASVLPDYCAMRGGVGDSWHPCAMKDVVEAAVWW